MLFKHRLNKTKITRSVCRYLSILLCVITVCSVALSTKTLAANDSVAYLQRITKTAKSTKNNGLIFMINTGTVAGKNVPIFLVTYKDDNGFEHKEVFDTKSAEECSSSVFSSWEGCNFYDSNDAKSKYVQYFGYSDEPALPRNIFTSHGLDYLYFVTEFNFASLVSLQFLGVYEAPSSTTSSSANEWGINYLKVIKAGKRYASTTNAATGRRIPVFQGEVIYELDSTDGVSYTWPKGSQLNTFSLKPVTGQTFDNYNDIFYCQIDIADAFGAGLEEFLSECGEWSLPYKYDFTTCKFHDTLLLSIKYEDSMGYPYTVKIPVVSTYIIQMIRSLTQSGGPGLTSDDWFDGLFRQGDTIGFGCYLPFCTKITGFDLTYSNKSSTFSDVLDTSKLTDQKLGNGSETFIVSGIRIYSSANGNNIGYKKENHGVTTVIKNEDSLMAYYFSNTQSGDTIKLNSSEILSVSATTYKKGDTNTRVSYNSDNLYVVSLTTDSAENSGTFDKIYATFYYTKLSTGLETTSDEVDLCSAAGDYYGWYPIRSYGDNITGFTYVHEYDYHVSAGQTLNFFVKISDVDEFTGMSLRKGGSDEWQFASVSIYKVGNRGTRTCSDRENNKECIEFTVGDKTAKYTCDRAYDRTFKTKVQLAHYEEVLLLQGSDPIVLDFKSGKSTVQEIDFNEYTSYMTFEDTKKDFGFTDEKVRYSVEVLVGSDVNTSEANGNCGSSDNFYFQLVFANGKSGYVLANDQLSADGFRTGQKETFTISTNRDYGELVTVKIIPESAREDAESFDKLMIDTITVTKVGVADVSLCWEIYVDKWISVDYVDTGAKYSVLGQEGREESEVSRSFNVTSSSYNVNIMVAVTTGTYTSDTEKPTGGLYAKIAYVDLDDKDREMDVDVVQAIHSYANLTAKNEVTVGTTKYKAIDESFMFKANLTNRFQVSVPKLKSIKSIKFTGFSNSAYKWSIATVSMYTIENEGRIIYSSAGEYVSTADYTFLCSTTQASSLQILTNTTTGTTSPMTVTANEVKVETNSGSFSTTIDTYPQNQDDTMNVYVFMGSNADSVTKYDMVGAVKYKDSIHDTDMQTSIKFKVDKANNMFYKTGVMASGLSSLTSITLMANAASVYTKAYPSYVLIEHVRSGVIIDKTYFYYGSTDNVNVKNGLTANPSQNVATEKYKQVLKFMTSSDTHTVDLKNKVNDLVVSFTYVEKNGSLTHSLTTKNVFLSDIVDNSFIEPSTVYTVEFFQEDVYEVKYVNFTAMGKLMGRIGIENACVGNYLSSATADSCVGWYGFGNGLSNFSAATKTMACTSLGSLKSVGNISVSDVNISITTAEAQELFESGTDAPVKMTVSYYDLNDNIDTVVIDDINDYAVSGTTNVNDTIELNMLVNGLRSLHSVKLQPVKNSETTNESWTVKNVAVKYTVDGKTYEPQRKVDKTATESEPITISFGTVELKVSASGYNKSTNISIAKTYSSASEEEPVSLLVPAGVEVTLTPELVGSSLGVSCACYKVTSNDKKIDGNSYITTDGNFDVTSATFKSNEEGLYYVEFTSLEFESAKVTVPITVERKVEETTKK